MFYLMIVVFILGYTAIALEHPLKVNKSATAMLLAVTMWVLFIIGGEQILVNASNFREFINKNPTGSFTDWISHRALLLHLGEISGILFFLLGAMTIVELIDSHEGFRIITDKIKTTNKVKTTVSDQHHLFHFVGCSGQPHNCHRHGCLASPAYRR